MVWHVLLLDASVVMEWLVRWVVFVVGKIYYVYLLVQIGRTALMEASQRGYVDCVEALLHRGADPNIPDRVSSTKAVRCLLLMCVLVVCVTRESDKCTRKDGITLWIM